MDDKESPLDDKTEKLFRELDKGITDMESGSVIPHDEAMLEIHERIKKMYMRDSSL